MSKTLQAVVSEETAYAVEALAIRRGMLNPSGSPNMSAATRYVIEFGLTSLRLGRQQGEQRETETDRASTD